MKLVKLKTECEICGREFGLNEFNRYWCRASHVQKGNLCKLCDVEVYEKCWGAPKLMGTFTCEICGKDYPVSEIRDVVSRSSAYLCKTCCNRKRMG